MDANHFSAGSVKTASGFTLIEMMTAIFVLAILATLAAPAFTTMIANNRVSAAASDVQSLFLYSRAEAVYLRTRLQVSANGQTWQARKEKATDVLREVALPPVVAATIKPAGAVTFETSGVANPPVKVILTAPKASRQFCVEVTRTGLVRSNRQNVGGAC